MTDKNIQELFKNMPEDFVQGFKNLAETFKRKDVEYEHKELLRYRAMREREQRKESLPEPEFTKAKRAERTSEVTSEVTSEISEDLEKAARKYAGIPEDTPHDLKYCVQDKKAKYDAVLYGANWQKQQDAISAKNLEELISTLSKRYPEVSFAKLSRIAVRVAKWQKQQMDEYLKDMSNEIDLIGD